jgi:hypothetical protein
MNSDNLIRLGAFAQCAFSMGEDFKILWVPEDAKHTINIITMRPATAKLVKVEIQTVGELAFEYNIILRKVGWEDNIESVHIGYSLEANVLVIQETSPL